MTIRQQEPSFLGTVLAWCALPFVVMGIFWALMWCIYSVTWVLRKALEILPLPPEVTP